MMMMIMINDNGDNNGDGRSSFLGMYVTIMKRVRHI